MNLDQILADLRSLAEAMRDLGHANATARLYLDNDGGVAIHLNTNGEKAFRWYTDRSTYDVCSEPTYAEALNAAKLKIATKLDPSTEISCANWFSMEGAA